MKVTAIAHPNLALIKYWGRKNEELRLPANGSISINLSEMTTTTTVEFSEIFQSDQIQIGKKDVIEDSGRLAERLDRIRKLANSDLYAKVVSVNNFPSSTGLSSSSSGFAALTLAASSAIGLNLSEKELTILARQGSGSACRSIPNGWVEWNDASSSNESYAQSIFPSDHWDIVDIVAVVSSEKKDVPTSQGQKLAQTSPFFTARQAEMPDKISKMKTYIEEKDFVPFGELVEAEALNMHAIMITSTPSLIYWSIGTLRLIKQIKKWRNEGLPAFFTINTGQDIHILIEKGNLTALKKRLINIPYIQKIFVNKVSDGAEIVNQHLF